MGQSYPSESNESRAHAVDTKRVGKLDHVLAGFDENDSG